MKLEGEKSFGLIIILSLTVGLYALLRGELLITSFGLSLVTFSFLLYIMRLGSTIPILEFMMLVATAQWILGAHFAYVLDFDHFKYYMYVEKEQYMDIVVPGTASFILGILIMYPKLSIAEVDKSIRKIADEQPKIAYFFIVTGFVVPFAQPVIPAMFGFVIYLLSSLKYVGIALLLFRKNSRQKWQLLIGVMAFSLVASLKQGMFHDLLLWGALMFSFVAMVLKLRFLTKLGIIAAGIFFIILLQSIKFQYRELIRFADLDTESKVELFQQLLSEKFSALDEVFNKDFLGELNIRLNQGWIISAIIDNIPTVEPFANGETIKEAIVNSFVPRFLDPSKKRAGGQENFNRFTGLPINASTTSMGPSILGEAYGNFGVEGSWLFMFGWGMFLSFVFGVFVRFGKNHPIIFFFLPVIFLQVIKAESELYVVLNHFIKSTVLVFLLLWGCRRILNFNI